MPMGSNTLQPIAKNSVTELVVDRIRAFIVETGLKPGDRLPSERELMSRLSVGRSSLREAVMILKALGIVEVQVGEGMFVGRGNTNALTEPLSWSVLMSEANMQELLQARKIIEVELAALAARNADHTQIESLSKTLEELQRAAETPKAELDFHVAVARAAGNRLLFHVFNTLQQMDRALMLSALSASNQPTAGKPRELSEELPAILKAIREREPEAARAAMRTHLESVAKRLFDCVSNGSPQHS